MSQLAPVSYGWTGSISVTSSGITVTVAPEREQSVASVVLLLMSEVRRMIGGTWTLSAPSGVITIAGPSFDLAISGTTATRLALSSASGVTSVTGSGAYVGSVITSACTLSVADVQTSDGRLSADGASAPLRETDSLSLTVLPTSYASAWTLEETYGVHDVWQPDREIHAARVWITGWSRERRQGGMAGQLVLTARGEVVR